MRLIRQKPEEIMIIDEKTMNEKGKKQRMFQWRALPSPKMPWETFKRMISMSRFKDIPEEERSNEILRVWRRRGWTVKKTINAEKDSH